MNLTFGSSWFSRLRTWLYEGRSPEEQRYLLKLDFYLISSAMLGYFIKNLNSKNMSTLYMNGMSDYYHMDKNEFNYMQSSFFIGYLLGGFPSKYLMGKFKIRYYLGFLELMWALLTFSMCFCQNISQIYLVRFLIGLLELGFFPSLVFIIGSFYNEKEVNKRQLLFSVSGTIGTMVTGPLQQLILTKDINFKGFEKFQILFLLDTIISVPIAFYTLTVNPGVPSQIDVWYLDEADIIVLRQRLDEMSPSKSKSCKHFSDYFKTWHVVVFPLLFAVIRNASFAAEQIVATSWIKYDLKLPSSYYNYFPAVINGIAVLLTLSVSAKNDKYRGAYTPRLLYTYFILYLFGSILLVYWKIPVLLHWICYIVFGSITWSTPLLFSWINCALAGDNERRHFIVVLTNSFDYLIYAIYPVWAWDTRDKPYFRKGFICTAILSVLGCSLTYLTYSLTEKDNKTEFDEETPLLSET